MLLLANRIEGPCVPSHVWHFVTPWTITYQAPLFMGSFKQEYCNELPFPTPGHLPDAGIKPESLALADGFSTIELSEKPIPPLSPLRLTSLSLLDVRVN